MKAPVAYHAMATSSLVNGVVSLEVGSILVLSCNLNPKLRSSLDKLHEGSQLLVRHSIGVNLEELNEAGTVIGFLKVEVSIIGKHFCHIFTRKPSQESFFEAQIDRSRESGLSTLLLDPRGVVCRIKKVKAFRAESF